MSRSKADILKDARKAYDMLERAKYDCDIFDDIPGPVNPAFAIGWAKSCLRRALELPDQPEDKR